MRFTLLTIYVAAGVAQASPASPRDPISSKQLRCRTAPKETALLVRTYGDEDVIDLQCRTTGSLTVNRTVQWLRTDDSCYIPALFVQLDDATRKQIPECVREDGARPCVLPNLAGFALIERYGAFYDQPQKDSKTGAYSIGFGHECVSSNCDQESTIVSSYPLSKSQATVLLWQDVRETTDCLDHMLSDRGGSSLVLTDNMWSALASWTFSIGCDQAARSKLIADIKKGVSPVAVARDEFPKWAMVNGKPDPGLKARRDAELTLFQTRSSSRAYPRCDQIR
ncbi:hypothetical protein FBU31_000917 [Coemansia sp. 'formosensis']|nr:hypothetical protein FBU31_000917 [Coemansia sp. 'formosensis']